MPDIRVRFAPSPTGYLHVGGARTALYNWLFARRHGGVLILRIEDTDADRSKPELTTAILESLNWLGLKWDEGPIHQSDRVQLYREMAAKLEQLGHAYPCFCTPEELRLKRERAEAEHRAWKYDGACRRLSAEGRAKLRAEGRASALRFGVPENDATEFDDLVFGRVELQNSEIEDFILLRSDGQPTYHLGVVADDLDMRVTHVIRGADHLSNTPKQVLMYRALGAPVPIFAHLPLILGPDRSRLSKRHGATSVGAYREQGVLPEALVNFLVLLGWTPPGGKEIVSLQAMISDFDLAAVSKSNAVFDPEKLAWMNAEYLRNSSLDRLLPLVLQELASAGLSPESAYGANLEKIQKAVSLLQTRARTLKDFSQSGRAFFSDDFEYEPEAAKKFWKDPQVADLMDRLAGRLEGADSFDLETTEKTLRTLAEESGVKAGLLINASRVALTGQGVAPGLFDVMVLLGRERTVARLRLAAGHLRRSEGNTM
jgi:glutamyl-tRNA synthetase